MPTLLRRLTLTSALALPLVASCSNKPATAITVAVTSEGRVPDDVDYLEIVVTREGDEKFLQSYVLGKDASLPGTLTLHDPDETGRAVKVVVRARLSSQGTASWRVLREARLGFSKEKTKLLKMPLRFVCFETPDCPDGQTCVGGSCQSAEVTTDALPEFTGNEQVARPAASGACFDESRCTDGWVEIARSQLDERCSIAAPARVGTFNMIMKWKFAPDRPIIIDPDDREGFTLDGDRVVLSPGICQAFTGKPDARAQELGFSVSCPTRDPSLPVCISSKPSGGAGGAGGGAGQGGAGGAGGAAGAKGGEAGQGGAGGWAGASVGPSGGASGAGGNGGAAQAGQGGGGQAGQGGGGQAGQSGGICASQCTIGFDPKACSADCTELCACSDLVTCKVDPFCCEVAFDAACIAVSGESCMGCAGGAVSVQGVESKAAQLSLGVSGGCAAPEGQGLPFCWGTLTRAALTNAKSETGIAYMPRALPFVGNVTMVAAGEKHMCFLLSSGAVGCAGDNQRGQLATGAIAPFTGLAGVPLQSNAIKIAAAGSRTYALLDDGTVWGWGANGNEVLGNNDSFDALSPSKIPLPLDETIKALLPGPAGGCALANSGLLFCWGQNSNGEVGDGTNQIALAPSVVQVSTGMPLDLVTSAAMGETTTCATREDGSLWCWGLGDFGAFADGNGAPHASMWPSQIMSADLGAIAAGPKHFCATVRATGEVRCWGINLGGVLGVPNDAVGCAELAPGAGAYYCATPQTVQLATGGPLTKATALTASSGGTCALLSTGESRCWGTNAVVGVGVMSSPTGSVLASPLRLLTKAP